MGDRAIATAISDAVHGLEEELCLPYDSLLSGTSILFEDSSFEEEDQVRDRFLAGMPPWSTIGNINIVFCSLF